MPTSGYESHLTEERRAPPSGSSEGRAGVEALWPANSGNLDWKFSWKR